MLRVRVGVPALVPRQVSLIRVFFAAVSGDRIPQNRDGVRQDNAGDAPYAIALTRPG